MLNMKRRNYHSYQSRREYLLSLSEDYNIPIRVVLSIARALGPSEDFDGLISALDNYE